MDTYLKCMIKDYNTQSDKETLPNIPIVKDVNFKCGGGEQLELYETLNNMCVQKSLFTLEADDFFRRARKSWLIIEESLKQPSLFREDIAASIINLLMFTNQVVREYKNCMRIKTDVLKHLGMFKKSIQRICNLDVKIINRLASTNIVIATESVSRYFHQYLAVNYLILTIESECNASGCVNDTVEKVLKDFLCISYKLYEKHENILNYQPFSCYCVKNFWWCISNLMYTLYENYEEFWTIFNHAVEDTSSEFCFWILRHVAILQCYDQEGVYVEQVCKDIPNIKLIDKKLNSFISTNVVDDKRLCNVIEILTPVITELWVQHVKLVPYQILWEYYSKRLKTNTLEYMAIPKTYKEIIKTITSLKTRKNMSRYGSYEHFISILYKYLIVHPQQWSKFKGRIYSSLSLQKINEFSDTSVYKISILFLTLLPIDQMEISERLQSLLQKLPRKRQISDQIWIIYMALVLISLQENYDNKKLLSSMQALLDEISQDREKYSLIELLLLELDDDMITNANCSLLFGPWVSKYMKSCVVMDMKLLLHVLVQNLCRVKENGTWYDVKPVYIDCVLPGLKQIAVSKTCSFEVGKLGSLIMLGYPECTADLVKLYCEDPVNITTSYHFLSCVLKECDVVSYGAYEKVFFQTWVKLCLLDVSCQDTELSRNVLKFDLIQNTIDIHFSTFLDPLPSLIKALNKAFQSQMNKQKLKDICEIGFGSVDSWIVRFLMETTSETQVFSIYTDLSLLFYHCAALMYHKSKANCLLNRLITALLLPTEVLMGKRPQTRILNAISRTWHLYVKGIYSLNHYSDTFIERIVKDMIVKYLPFFTPVNSPIVKVLDEPSLAEFTLEKIVNSFLVRGTNSSEENCIKALKILHNILELIADDDLRKLITEKILVGVFEVIMFRDNRHVGLRLIKLITSSTWYEYVRAVFHMKIQYITEKHMAFSTNKYFQFLQSLIDIIPDDVRQCLPHIKDYIAKVEYLRGVGFDNALQQHFVNIKRTLS